MSLSGVNPDVDDVPVPAQPEPPGTGRRWSIPQPPRLSLPLTGMLIFAGIRVLSVAIAAFLLGHGKYQLVHWSLVRWMRSSDGGHYTAIAAHGYTYPAGQLAHASVFLLVPRVSRGHRLHRLAARRHHRRGGSRRDGRRRAGGGVGAHRAGHEADRRPADQPAHGGDLGGGAEFDGLVHDVRRGAVLRPGHLGAGRPGQPAVADRRPAHPRGRDRAQHRPGAHPGHLRRGADRGDPGGAGAPALRPVVAGAVAAAGRRAAGSAGAAGLPGIRGAGDAPAGRMVLGREARLPHDLRLGDEHAARGQGHAARHAFGRRRPGGGGAIARRCCSCCGA